ncbi:TAXI family TRAP transporter solute-binding subunit [Desulfovibrio ferrophilus]|uniref:TRAP transporter solute receptor, TAXI family n=1 Tax=Desulfovibrio ferrophilus TaxID=241368 RepID=A0A2Z6AVD8_9BACT|nr:TAXI family TRAP transporter solute-binding subunit [Desulfovibrio ferrophilus]BBD07197.1 TRAP transporter solute receptor, TAXI family [Desulfovibrio ferrophilus]
MLRGLKRNLLVVAALAIALSCSAPAFAKSYLAYGGGPVGGTFNYFANAMASYITNTYADIEVSSEGSGGSTANLKRLNKGDVDFGIVYSGDAFLGRHGRLPQDATKYDKVRAMAFLYGAPAHLVVKKKDGITSAMQLEGKRVAVGNAGSGAAAAAERFFTHLGLWDKIQRQNMGYSAAAAAFNDGKLDAFWVFVGYPNSSVIEAAARDDIQLVDVGADAEKYGFYKEYPFYSPMEIPAGTYRGQDMPTKSFQDAAYWCTNANVDDEMVYKAIKAIYTPEGLKHMVAAKKTAKSMNIPDGLKGVSVPVAPGAAKFWKENGLNVPDIK